MKIWDSTIRQEVEFDPAKHCNKDTAIEAVLMRSKGKEVVERRVVLASAKQITRFQKNAAGIIVPILYERVGSTNIFRATQEVNTEAKPDGNTTT